MSNEIILADEDRSVALTKPVTASETFSLLLTGMQQVAGKADDVSLELDASADRLRVRFRVQAPQQMRRHNEHRGSGF